MFRDRNQFEPGINAYVPGMQYSNAVSTVQPQMFSLGSPAASDDDLFAVTLAANAAANTVTASLSTAGVASRYGQNVIVTVSGDPGAAGGVLEVRGFDYLGQPMLERFTGANGSTAILYGQKAFKKVMELKIITATTNAVTYKVGTGTRVGLPYRGDVVWAKENGILIPTFNRDQVYAIHRDAAQAAAGGSVWVRAQFPGYVKSLFGTPDGGGGAVDPVITVELGGVAITGLTVTIDTSDVTGLTVTDTPTTAGYRANNRFVTNGLIEIVGAAAAGAFSDTVGVVLTPTQFSHPDVTDPATATTGDPRGTYDPITPPAGFEIVVGMVGDNAVNTSNNGGLHGIRHFFS